MKTDCKKIISKADKKRLEKLIPSAFFVFAVALVIFTMPGCGSSSSASNEEVQEEKTAENNTGSEEVQEPAETCYDLPVYTGVNSIPAVTMSILPSNGGDTITNDLEHPPGQGPVVVVGYWEFSGDDTLQAGETPCDGEPTFKIAYPVTYGPDNCYAWTHWVEKDDPHPNSANDFTCEDGGISFTQWTTYDCSGSEQNPTGKRKSAWMNKCCQDSPPTIYSQVLEYSGCESDIPSDSGNNVTFTVYTDELCTQLPAQNSSTVTLDITKPCNETPDASISNIECYEDRITYTNHPNNNDCTGEGYFNELPVGVCTEFPGPVRTWKYIDPVTYNCSGEPQ